MKKRIVVLFHGWGVHNTETYGALPERLRAEAQRAGDLNIDLRQIWLSRYISFHDEVRFEDVSRAFDAAIHQELGRALEGGARFVCITHSTGGPVVRDWWDRYYVREGRARACPMSHLIMLAPPNFGSALAQLGKSRISRLKSWFEGVEPGRRILDWLELGSPEAWELNRRWFDYPDTTSGRHPLFLFVLTGQQIDRALYDHINSYTGELGSDGVIRVAAANLNATYVRLEQAAPREIKSGGRLKYEAPLFRVKDRKTAPRTAFRLIENRSHSGKKMGIMRSVGAGDDPDPTVKAALECLRVESHKGYLDLCDRFDRETAEIEKRELLERHPQYLLDDQTFIHDPHAMVIFRVQDDRGYIIDDFELELTAGQDGSPDHLPSGFFRDRQINRRHRGTLTYFLNHAIMAGCDAVVDREGAVIRGSRSGAEKLGFRLRPYLDHEDLVQYLPAELEATPSQLELFLKPHQTTMVEITLKRLVRERVFRLTKDQSPKDFKKGPSGPYIPS